MKAVVLENLAAVQALALRMNLFYSELAAARERVLVAKRLPRKVKRLAHNFGHIPDTQRYQNAREAPAPRAARITVSSMPLTMPTSCIPIYSSSSSSSENRSRRLTNRPSLPSRAVMTTRAIASEIS